MILGWGAADLAPQPKAAADKQASQASNAALWRTARAGNSSGNGAAG
jgi:hypothetical protein